MTTDWLFWIGGGLLGLAGLWLCYWALIADRAKGCKRCPKCWYNMQATENLRCPECGNTVKTQRKLLKTRRRWRWAFVAILLLLGSYILEVTPRYRKSDWRENSSNSLLVLHAYLLDDPESFEIVMFRAVQVDRHIFPIYMAHEENLSDWQWRLMMSYVLRELKKLPDGVPDPQIYSYLSSGAPYSRLAIETISSLIKKSSDKEVSGIISKLESKDRLNGLFPNESKAWINTLVYTLTRGETQSRLSIVYALSGYGSKAVIAIPQLLNLLNEGDEDLREAVAQSFGEIVANPFATWHFFVGDENKLEIDEYKLEIDARIADSLSQAGISRQDVAEALSSVFESDESEEIKLASAISICQLTTGGPQAHEVILDHLTRSDGPHLTILWALYSVSSKPQYLLPGLEFMLKNKQDYSSRAIKEAEEMKKLILESDSP